MCFMDSSEVLGSKVIGKISASSKTHYYTHTAIIVSKYMYLYRTLPTSISIAEDLAALRNQNERPVCQSIYQINLYVHVRCPLSHYRLVVSLANAAGIMTLKVFKT